ncbi:type IV secretion system protein VirB9 [Gemmobacter aquatilis]|uniref:Type IV secretion system protein VirB9 n=1 Tax=Gemmobacter aquatilis TaxID=933059 RepID=A0A1H8MPY0_9RHOB|nr:TrbG/VirB9 family P-type conjugative transfer protein [Gemmobacter aquatilis]SEO19511.1 type IV secretion system protein VirB9 [Gemmobacter aquatilis]
MIPRLNPISLGLMAGLAGLPAFAETAPKPGSRDARVTYATYQQGQVYRITTQLRNVTLIELGEGEKIQSIAIGDLESFKIDKLERANLFIIKPVVAGATTNLTVETQRNIYFLQVSESSKGSPNYSVKFTVPGAGRNSAIAAEMPTAVPMTYKVMKKGQKLPAFAPISISDDGRKTTFVIPPGAPMPTIFRADAKGQEYSVNSAVRSTMITVSTRSERWVLRYGEDYVCVTADAGVGQ